MMSRTDSERTGGAEGASMPSEGAGAAPVAAKRRGSGLPSPVFVAVLGIAVLGGWLAWNRVSYGPFLLVLGGWVASVAAHEYAHARLAYAFGDRGLRGQGYLTLNPLRYRDGFSGVVLPVVVLLMGGFGMTGPATYLNHSAVPGRVRRSLVAAVGPLVNLLLAAAVATSIALLLAGRVTDSWFWASLVYLVFLQLTAAIVNLLPVPGMDGFGIIAPYLPGRLGRQSPVAGVFGAVAVFGILWFPPVHQMALGWMFDLFTTLGLNPLLLGLGQAVFPFWSG